MQYFVCSTRQPSSYTRLFFSTEIDLHSLIFLPLSQLSRCQEENEELFASWMTWSHIKQLLVIGSFLLRHCTVGCVASGGDKWWNNIWLLKMCTPSGKHVQSDYFLHVRLALHIVTQYTFLPTTSYYCYWQQWHTLT